MAASFIVLQEQEKNEVENVKNDIYIRAYYSGWHKVTLEQAKCFVISFLASGGRLTREQQIKRLNSEHLRGITVEQLLKKEEPVND